MSCMYKTTIKDNNLANSSKIKQLRISFDFIKLINPPDDVTSMNKMEYPANITVSSLNGPIKVFIFFHIDYLKQFNDRTSEVLDIVLLILKSLTGISTDCCSNRTSAECNLFNRLSYM